MLKEADADGSDEMSDLVLILILMEHAQREYTNMFNKTLPKS